MLTILYRHNTDSLIAIGLNLISVVIECGSSHLCRFPALAGLVQDSLCKNLFRVSRSSLTMARSQKYISLSLSLSLSPSFQLLRHDNFGLFSHALRSCYLLLESCRQDLKLQLEVCMSSFYMYILEIEIST